MIMLAWDKWNAREKTMTGCRGFVLAGGNSARMGQDKALLPFGSSTLAAWMAELVGAVAEGGTIVGSAAKYGGRGGALLGGAV